MKRIKRRMAGIILIVMLLTILLSPGSFSAWADKTDDAVDDEFDISAIIDNGDDVIVVPAEDSADSIVPGENVIDEEGPYQVGDIITFGKYEQDGDVENGKEDIEWQVLKVEADRVLVVSKYALDCQPYNTEYADVTWETCSLRTWLNNDFLNAAFSEEEQENIPEVVITNEDNSYYGTAGGNETMDQVFCLSANEVKDLIGYTTYDESYYGYSQNLIVQPTQYSVNSGSIVYCISESDYDSFLKDKGYSSEVVELDSVWWWLRSSGCDNKRVCSISPSGSVGANYIYATCNNRGAVRPAIFINMGSELKTLEADVAKIGVPLEIPMEDVEGDEPIISEDSEEENDIIDEDNSENIEDNSEDTEDNSENTEDNSENTEDNSENTEDNSENIEDNFEDTGSFGRYRG